MSDKKPQKKEHKLNASEKIDLNCFKMFGYVPVEITEINEVLDDCDSLISYHMENTGSLSEQTREKIAKLAIKQDLLNIEIDDLFLTALDHLRKAREVGYLKKEPTSQKDEAFLGRIVKIKQDVRELLHEIKDYIKDLENHKFRY